MNHSESLSKLAPALVKAVQSIPQAKFDTKAYHGGFASLKSYMDTARPALEANGLVVIHMGAQANTVDTFHMSTMVIHQSGEWIEGTMSFSIGEDKRGDGQAIGSLSSYAKRYGLAGILGMVSGDDDGQAASQPPGQQAQQSATTPDEKLSGDLRISYEDRFQACINEGEISAVSKDIRKDLDQLTDGDLKLLRVAKENARSNTVPF